MTTAASAPEPATSELCESSTGPVRVAGKFFTQGDRKLYVKGVAYGPFRPAADGVPLPGPEVALADMRHIRALGANTIRTYTPPPAWFLDLAGEEGLRVIAGVPWAQHVCFLEDRHVAADARRRVDQVAREVGRHPALLALLVGNETPPDVVRWQGPKRVERFLAGLYDLAKQSAPETLVSYANFPPTEYLDLSFLDFICFNVYLHREPDLRRYLMRLQNLAEDKPLVVGELGIDSQRLGVQGQADILSWQIGASFELGAAGLVVFSWTDEWFALSADEPEGGFAVADWSFGLVDTKRAPKPAFAAVQSRFQAPVPALPRECPRVSVVVCAFNAEPTIALCLRSLEALRYPNFEVIVVDDGSTDRTATIAREFAGATIRIVSQENRGLSLARNRGMAEARGDIIAFTDSDCMVDPDWLTYLVLKLESGFVAVGGPNLPPPEDSLVRSVVAMAPGGPTHVLLDDDRAEHIPGCNMAFRRSALEGIGGFDAQYATAGDDVDLCWRLQDAGHAIGFSAGALVWHFRRPNVSAYLRQQRGYGRAEALLYFKHRLRFNALGQSRWIGRVYGGLVASLSSRRPMIYHGTFGEGLFQTLYQRPASVLQHLPLTLEWNVVAILLLISGAVSGELPITALPLAISFLVAALVASRSRVDARFDGVRARMLLAALVYLGPLVRSFERTSGHVGKRRGASRTHAPQAEDERLPPLSFRTAGAQLAYWSESGLAKSTFLHELAGFLEQRQFRVATDSGWSSWDLEVARGPWASAHIEVAVENHGGGRRLFRVRVSLQPARVAVWTFTLCALAAATGWMTGVPGLPRLAGLVAMLSGATVIARSIRLSLVTAQVIDIVARRLGLAQVERAASASHGA